MSKRSWWVVGFLTVTSAAVLMELYAAFDNSPNTVPWTDLILNLPVPVWAAATAVLVVWLPIHFVIYKRKRLQRRPMMAELDPNDNRSEPLLTRAAVVAVVTVVLDAAVAFGLHVSNDQKTAAVTAISLVAPLALGWWARRHVVSPKTANELLAAKDPGR